MPPPADLHDTAAEIKAWADALRLQIATNDAGDAEVPTTAQPARRPPMTPAERQRQHRARVAAARPGPQPDDEPAAAHPLDGRLTRQEAWDAAAETIEILIENYRCWRMVTPAPAGALRITDLPRLAALSLALALVQFPEAFGQEWHLPGLEDPFRPIAAPDIDARSLRQQLFAADPTSDPDRFPRTPEEDARGMTWWARIPPDARETWQRAARSNDPLDVWYVLNDVLKNLV